MTLSLTRLCLLAAGAALIGTAAAQTATVPADALAWRSVTPPISPVGPAVHVLASAKAGGVPLLWLPAEQRLQAVALPVVPQAWPAGTRAVLEEVGPFGHGLAPARVRWEPPAGGPAATTAWGYVDAAGRWAIAPQYGAASPFFGPAAMVMAPGPALIDREGRRLPWQASRGATNPLPGPQTLASFELRGWPDSLLVSERQRRRDAPGGGVWLADVVQGGRVQPLPGDYGHADPTGQLWVVQNFEGHQAPRLWSPARGALPPMKDLLAQRALAPDAVLVRSQDPRQNSFELRSADGRLLIAGLSQAFALDAHHIVGCVEGDQYMMDAEARTRALGGLAGYRCGVLAPDGSWLQAPAANWMALDGPWLRLQSPQGLCEFDLREPRGSCQAPAVPSGELVIGNEAPGSPRPMRYRGTGVSPELAALRFDEAGRFVGRVAAATQDGVPGVIDRNGRWLTPRPPADPLQRAGQAFAARLQAQPDAAAHGVIDARGRFVLPPLFQVLFGEDDAQGLLYCTQPHYGVGCQRIDIQGRPLPPRPPDRADTTGKAAPALPALRFGTAGAGPFPEGRNGRWGYRDAAGRWVIEPRFAAAEAFDGNVAIAAVESAPAGDDAEPQLRWGLIDRQGRWLAEPLNEELERLGPGLMLARSANEWQVMGVDGRPRGDSFAEMQRLGPGLVVLHRGDRKSCLLNSRGDCPVLPEVRALRLLDAGRVIADVTVEGRDAMGVLDAESRWLIPPRFIRLQPFGPGHLVAEVRMPQPGVTLPAIPPQGVVTGVQALHAAGLVAVSLATPGGPRVALLRADGRWLTEAAR